MDYYKFTVIIIEDDISVSQSFEKAFLEKGIKALYIKNSNDIYKISNEKNVSSFLIDIVLEDENGVNVGQLLEKDPLFEDCLIFYMSGIYTDDMIVKELLSPVKHSGFFKKPLEISAVVQQIEKEQRQQKMFRIFKKDQIPHQSPSFDKDLFLNPKRFESSFYEDLKIKVSSIDIDFLILSALSSHFLGVMEFASKSLNGSINFKDGEIFQIKEKSTKKMDYEEFLVKILSEDQFLIHFKSMPVKVLDSDLMIDQKSLFQVIFNKWYFLGIEKAKSFFDAMMPEKQNVLDQLNLPEKDFININTYIDLLHQQDKKFSKMPVQKKVQKSIKTQDSNTKISNSKIQKIIDQLDDVRKFPKIREAIKKSNSTEMDLKAIKTYLELRMDSINESQLKEYRKHIIKIKPYIQDQSIYFLTASAYYLLENKKEKAISCLENSLKINPKFKAAKQFLKFIEEEGDEQTLFTQIKKID